MKPSELGQHQQDDDDNKIIIITVIVYTRLCGKSPKRYINHIEEEYSQRERDDTIRVRVNKCNINEDNYVYFITQCELVV